MTLHSQIWRAMVLALLTTSLAHGQCGDGFVQDCDDSDCISSGWIGDGFCDGFEQEGGANLCCYLLDGGDCTDEECDFSLCGDGVCSFDEDASSCPVECFCGDGFCAADESPATCPDDCAASCQLGEVADCADSDCVSSTWIGDGFCDGVDQEYGADLCCYFYDGYDCTDEECYSSVCGDGVCSVGEDPSSCPTDCFCGDGVCSVGEDASSCPADCDLCPDDPDKIEPGLCGCGVADTDTDADGTPDCLDDCPDDPAKTAPGNCGCGVADTDTDADGTSDCLDDCPDDPAKTVPGNCGCGTPETTTFGDVDCDGDYDADDARLAMAEFGIIEAGPCPADLNGDGQVDGQDLAAVLAAWGLPCDG